MPMSVSSSDHIPFSELSKLSIPITIGEFAVKSDGWAIDATKKLGVKISMVPTALDRHENLHCVNAVIKSNKSNVSKVFKNLKNEEKISDFTIPAARANLSFSTVMAPPADQSVVGALYSTPTRLVGSIDATPDFQRFTVMTSHKGALATLLKKLEDIGDVRINSYETFMAPSTLLINAKPDLAPKTRLSTYRKIMSVLSEAYEKGYYNKDDRISWTKLSDILISKGIINSRSSLPDLLKMGEHLAMEGYLGNPTTIGILKSLSEERAEKSLTKFEGAAS